MSGFDCIIKSEIEIRELIGYPSELVQHKTIDSLDDHCRRFLSHSPLLFMATSDEQGNCDVSPRGDAPGFVRVLDEKRLIIPERPGNRKIDSMRNILNNPNIGLIFIIPGLEETLRINGKACITKDARLLDELQAFGKSPLLGIGVTVEECFIHCAKAFKRSGLWKTESWPDKSDLPNVARMVASHVNLAGVTDETVAKALEESYTKRLY